MKFRATIRKNPSTGSGQGVADEVRDIEAPSRFAVYEQVQKEGGRVVALTEAPPGLKLPSWLFFSIGSGVKRIEIIHVAKNLSAMLAAGLSISRALSVIERQSENKRLKTVAVGLSESIRKGSSLHEALAAYPRIFPQLFIAMVRAGEESGSLSESLTIVALQMERGDQLARKIRGAMIYPSIVVTAIILVAILMLVYVVPTLTATFTQLNVPVPLATRAIIAISDFMAANAILVFALLAALVIGGVLFIRSRIGNRVLIAGALRLPVIGELVRETYAARAARTLSSLLASGVPVLDALGITEEVVRAEAFAQVVAEAQEHVRKGEPLSEAFSQKTKLYPVLMSDMLAVGEETGKVAEMLKQIAEFYEEDVSEKTKDLSTIIEPALILLIGAAVGVFAVAMISPIYSLSSAF